MSVPRQQRTLSRRRFDPGQGPLPVLIDLPNSSSVAGGFGILQFDAPIVMRGVPPILNAAGVLPANAVQDSDVQITLEWPGGVAPGDVLILPAWTPTLRGQNGEWVTPGRVLVGGVSGGGMPAVTICQEVISQSGSDAIWRFDAPIENIGAQALVINGNEANSYSVIGSGELLATYQIPVTPLDVWRIPTWPAAAYDAPGGLWLAPGRGIVI